MKLFGEGAHTRGHSVAQLPGGVCEITLRGAITPVSLPGVGEAFALAHRAGARALVVDWRGCLVALHESQLTDAPTWALNEPGLALPAAILTTDVLLEFLQPHAIRMARDGFFRRVFFDRPSAVLWAQERALAR